MGRMAVTAHHPIVPRYRTSGWAASFATHAIALSIVVFFFNGIHPIREPEPFRWDVSVMREPAPLAKAETAQSNQITSTPTDSTLQKPSPKNSAAVRERTVVESRSVSRPVQSQTPIVTKESQHAQQKMEPQPMPQETVHLQTAPLREVETINKTAETRTVLPNAAPLEQNLVAVSPQIRRQDAVLESDARPIETTQMVEERAIARLADPPVITERVAEERGVETPVPLETGSIQPEGNIASSTTQPNIDNDQAQVDATSAQISSAAGQPSPERKETAPSDQQAAPKSGPLQSNPGAKADYGWLREALWSRIERFKGYPYIARTNRWEGLVILEAVINSDGHLVDLRVVESSGHLALDRDAMEVMRKSCPLHLKQSLGKPEVKLQIPISYKLR